jgi:alkyl hydroperoxide reductase 1
MPQNYKASQEWKDKKVVLFAVPGAFTPGCSARHLPPYIEKLQEIKGKGVDIVAVVAFNDAWVMSAWGKANGVKDEILFMSDVETKFSKKIGWTMGERTARYAMIIDNGKIVYAEKEPGREVTVSPPRYPFRHPHADDSDRSRVLKLFLRSCRASWASLRDLIDKMEHFQSRTTSSFTLRVGHLSFCH